MEDEKFAVVDEKAKVSLCRAEDLYTYEIRFDCIATIEPFCLPSNTRITSTLFPMLYQSSPVKKSPQSISSRFLSTCPQNPYLQTLPLKHSRLSKHSNCLEPRNRRVGPPRPNWMATSSSGGWLTAYSYQTGVLLQNFQGQRPPQIEAQEMSCRPRWPNETWNTCNPAHGWSDAFPYSHCHRRARIAHLRKLRLKRLIERNFKTMYLLLTTRNTRRLRVIQARVFFPRLRSSEPQLIRNGMWGISIHHFNFSP